MVDLTSTDRYTIAGRGLVFCVTLTGDQTVSVGDNVRIDGEEYEIRGIETYRILTYPPITSPSVGLQVRPIRTDVRSSLV